MEYWSREKSVISYQLSVISNPPKADLKLITDYSALGGLPITIFSSFHHSIIPLLVRAFIIVLLFFPTSSSVWSKDYKKQLRKVEKELKTTEKEKKKLKRKEKNALKELTKIDREISSSKKNIKKLKTEEKRLEKSLKKLTATLEKTEDQIKSRQTLVKNEMLSLYQNDLSHTTQSSYLGERTNFYLQEMLENHKAQCKEYKITTDTLSAREQEEKENFLTLLETRKQKEKEQRKILNKHKKKKNILSKLKRQTSEKDKLIRELKKSRAQLEKLLKGMRAGAPIYPAGEFKNMIWPVEIRTGKSFPQGRQRVLSNFGTVVDPELGTTLINKGIDISADYDTPVLAVGNGKVVHEGVFLGYGKIILIDHENGFSTLYAHLSETLVTKGERINKSEVIGKAGSTGLTERPLLHFEVRKNGKAVNPLKYLP